MEQPISSVGAVNNNLVEVANTELAFRPIAIADRAPTARQVLATLNLAPHSEYLVLQWLPGGDIEEVRPEEQIDTTGAAAPRLIIVKADRTFRFVLNDHSLEWPEGDISDKALRILGSIDTAQQLYLTREDGADRLLEPDSVINLRHLGVENIYSKTTEWKLNVQGVTIVSPTPEITVRQALVDAGFDPTAAWIMVLKTASERKQVTIDDVIDLREPGVEKLRLTPREINNGESATEIKRDFALLATDEEWLTDRGYAWTTTIDAGRRWLILRDIPLPEGYAAISTTVAMEIPPSYPMAEIDMFYCFPPVARLDGQAIPQTQVVQIIENRPYQRWSRHRGAIAPWRPGKDSVVSHLMLVDASITREVEK